MFFLSFSESDFSQQKLPAWQPILTAGTVLPAFFVIGIAFVAIGVGLLHFSNEVLEYNVDYTQCKEDNSDNGEKCWEKINKTTWGDDPHPTCKCTVDIEIDQKMVRLYKIIL